jgi:aryl-phospho-beta-D-glucosidase BglC (GH1 family)
VNHSHGPARLPALAHSRFVLVLGGVLLVCCLTASRCETRATQPWVTSSGCGFVDRDGRPVVLRGFDLIAPEAPSVWSTAVELGANFVRIPVAWSEIEPLPPTSAHHWNARLLKAIDREVAYFRRRGVSVLLDFHQFRWSPYFDSDADGIPAWFYEERGYPRSSAGKDEAIADWWTDQAGLRAYSSFAVMMATRYRSDPNVIGYELFNEPATGALGESHAATQAVLGWKARLREAIRAVDPLRTIFVQTRGGGDLGLKNADFSVFGSLDNLAVDFHSYFNAEPDTGYSADGERWVPDWEGAHLHSSVTYSGTEEKQAEFLEIPLAKTHELGVPLLVGEWGVPNDTDGGPVYQRQMLRLLRRAGVSWARWDLGTVSSFGLLAESGNSEQLLAQLRAALREAPQATTSCGAPSPSGP